MRKSHKNVEYIWIHLANEDDLFDKAKNIDAKFGKHLEKIVTFTVGKPQKNVFCC